MIPHDIGWAIEQLKLRKPVRRHSWPASFVMILNRYNDLVRSDTSRPAAGAYLWQASTEELLATDWTSP